MNNKTLAIILIFAFIIVVGISFYVYDSERISPGEHLAVTLQLAPEQTSDGPVIYHPWVRVDNIGSSDANISRIYLLDANKNVVFTMYPYYLIPSGESMGIRLNIDDFPPYCMVRIFTVSGGVYDSKYLGT